LSPQKGQRLKRVVTKTLTLLLTPPLLSSLQLLLANEKGVITIDVLPLILNVAEVALILINHADLNPVFHGTLKALVLKISAKTATHGTIFLGILHGVDINRENVEGGKNLNGKGNGRDDMGVLKVHGLCLQEGWVVVPL